MKRIKNYQLAGKNLGPFFALSSLLIVYCSFLTPLAFGQGPSLSVSPLLIEHTLGTEKEFSLPFKVKNSGAEDLTLIASPREIKKQEKDGLVTYTKEPSSLYKQLFASFKITIEDEQIKEITLLPQEEKIITLTGRVPDPQDYYFSLFLISKPLKKPLQTSYSTVSTGVASHIFIYEKNAQKYDISISKYSIPVLVQKPPVPVQLEVSNKGISALKIGGKITFTNIYGKEVGTIALLPTYLLPGSSRTMESFEQADSNLPHLEWNTNLLFGPYTATVELSDSNNTFALKQSTVFLSLPTSFLIGLSVVFLAFIYITNRVRAKLK